MRLRRTEITVEKQQLFILKKSPSLSLRCTECSEESRMITPEEAAVICGAGTRAIYSWLDTKPIHFIETSRGAVLVCLNSLLDVRAPEA